jgi:hypothetical protein
MLRAIVALMVVRGDGNMSHLIRPVSVRPVAAKLTDLLISDSIGHAIGRGALEPGMAEAERLFHMLRGDLR